MTPQLTKLLFILSLTIIIGLSPALADEKTVTVSIDANDYTLLLTPKELNQPSLQLQLYTGTVVGDPDSWIRLSENENGLSGTIRAFGELLSVKKEKGNTLSSRRMRAEKVPFHQDFLDAPLKHSTTNNRTYPLSTRATQKSSSNALVLPINVVVDSKYNQYYNNQGLAKAISTIHEVDGIYQEQFGLALQIKNSVVLKANNDPFPQRYGNLEAVLQELRQYSIENTFLSKDVGVIHLFSGAHDSSGRIGLSWIDTTCRSDGYNSSISTPYTHSTLLAAHEIAHNLGADHDDSNSCEAQEYGHVMWSSISSNSKQSYSNCSKQAVLPSLTKSCILDNIDLGVSLAAVKTTNNSMLLELSISNSDAIHNATNVTSITQFANNLEPNSIPEDCSYFASTLTCNLSTLATNSSKVISIDLSSTGGRGEQLVTTELEYSNIADLQQTNNFASINLGEDVPTQTPTTTTSNDPATDSDDVNLGSNGLLLLSLLGLLAVIRKQAK